MPKQRQRRGLRNEINEVGAVKKLITTVTLWASSRSLCERNLPKALRFRSATLRGPQPWNTAMKPIRYA